MNSNSYKNDILHDNNSQRFRRIRTDWFQKTQQPAVPELYEQTVTETTTARINKETNTTTDEMTTTHLERSPMRRVNLVTGPQSAFARLFPDKYRQNQEQLTRTQRSKSTEDQRYNFDRIRNDADDYESTRKPRRVAFYDQQTDEHVSNPRHLINRTKSDLYLNDEVANIPLNYDPDPEIIYRDNPNKVVYVQKVGVRYLKPPTPPPPEPIIIREVHATPPKQPPPLIISSTPPVAPRTPSPLIVREEPPMPPQHQPARVITKTLPAPAALPRRVIIQRVPALPAKPRPVIIEKWLPYKTPAERPVIYERAEQSDQSRSSQRNVIFQYEPARVRVEQEIQNVGCFRVDPELYRTEHGSSLRRTDSIRKVLQDIGCNPDIINPTGYETSRSSHSTTNYSNETRTCYTDQQLSELINPPAPTHDYQTISSTNSRPRSQVHYTTVKN